MHKRWFAAAGLGAVVLAALPVAAHAQSIAPRAYDDDAAATAEHTTTMRGARVVLPDGDTAVLAPTGPIAWHPGKRRFAVTTALRMTPAQRVKSPLGLDDLDHLPAPHDGTAEAGSGLFARVPSVRGTELLNTAGVVSASPAALRVTRGPMAQPTAIGGGRGGDDDARLLRLAQGVVDGSWRAPR